MPSKEPYTAKEPCDAMDRAKRALCCYQKSPILLPKEPCRLRTITRVIYCNPKSPVPTSKEPYTAIKRALYRCQKSPIFYRAKELCIALKNPFTATKWDLFSAHIP